MDGWMNVCICLGIVVEEKDGGKEGGGVVRHM